MKKVLILAAFIVIATTIKAQSTVTAVVASNGIGLIPAFNKKGSATLGFAKLYVGKHWEFSPDAAMNTKDGKPWFVDIWIRQNHFLDSAHRWVGTLGFDYSPFFQPFIKNGEEVTQSVIYFAYQAKLKFIQSKKSSFALDYWYNRTAKRDAAYGVKGSYLSLTFSREEPLKKFIANANVNTFYISFSDNSKGLGVSYDASLTHKKSGLFIASQLVHSI
jgi:hypothetical protein